MSYDPTLILDLSETVLTFQNDNLHWCYVVVTVVIDEETSEEMESATIEASENHIDPLQYWESDGKIYYKIGYFGPVVDGKREAHLIWNNVKGGSGINGKSAYEIAVLNGFVGTEVQWLTSLVGNDGYTPYIQNGYWYINNVNSGVKAVGIDGSQPLQITGITLTSSNWVSNSGLYKYEYSNANITANSIVDVIPANASISVVKAAEVLPETDSSTGKVTLWATNAPTGDISVTINITEKQV